MDGKGVRKLTLDNNLIERLWRTLKYECVYCMPGRQDQRRKRPSENG